MTRATGFSPVLLRAWERRHHGLLDPERLPRGHRLYTDDDLRVLTAVRLLLDEGRSISEIAALGRPDLLALAPARPASASAQPAEPSGPAPELVLTLLRAAQDLDEAGIERALDQAFGGLSAAVAIADVVLPALRRVGDLWAAGQLSVAGEHLVSGRVVQRLRGLLDAARPAGAADTLVACLPDEEHEVGALVAAIELARAGRPPAYLGASVPLPDLERAIATLRPRLVVLACVHPGPLSSHAPKLVELAARWVGRTRFVAGGAAVAGQSEVLARGGILAWDGARPLGGLADALRAAPPRGSARG